MILNQNISQLVSGNWTSGNGDLFGIAIDDSFITGHLYLHRKSYLKIPIVGILDEKTAYGKLCFQVTTSDNKVDGMSHQSILFTGDFINSSVANLKYLYYEDGIDNKQQVKKEGTLQLGRLNTDPVRDTSSQLTDPFHQFAEFIERQVYTSFIADFVN